LRFSQSVAVACQGLRQLQQHPLCLCVLFVVAPMQWFTRASRMQCTQVHMDSDVTWYTLGTVFELMSVVRAFAHCEWSRLCLACSWYLLAPACPLWWPPCCPIEPVRMHSGSDRKYACQFHSNAEMSIVFARAWTCLRRQRGRLRRRCGRAWVHWQQHIRDWGVEEVHCSRCHVVQASTSFMTDISPWKRTKNSSR